MNDVIVGGVNITEIKKQLKSIEQEAVKIVSENIEIAQNNVNKMMRTKDVKELKELAEEAVAKLSTAKFLASTCGVYFYLPFRQEWASNYEINSYRLENAVEIIEDEVEDLTEQERHALGDFFDDDPHVEQLYSLFEDMESDSKMWHDSSC